MKMYKTLLASALVIAGCATPPAETTDPYFSNPTTRYEQCANAHATGLYEGLYNEQLISYDDFRRLRYKPGITSTGMSECAFLAVNGPADEFHIYRDGVSETTRYIYRSGWEDKYFYVTDGKVIGWEE